MSSDLKTGVAPFEWQFRREVLEGLNRQSKQQRAKYFYDATGDRLFQEIMQLPEHSPTHC